MPEWLHSRARHIQAKNPSMPESESFAIATQQSHALGKSPKGYGTSEAKSEAKKKYDTPKDDKKRADPGGIGKEKEAGFFGAFKHTAINPMIEDQTRQIVQEELAKMQPQQKKHPPKIKMAGISSVLDLIGGFSDELQKIALMAPGAARPATPSSIKTTQPKFAPNVTSVGSASKSPMQFHQPVLSPPPVRG